MNLLQTIRTIEEVAKGIPNVHTVVSAFEDLNREDTVYSAVIIQQQSHTHNDDWFQYNFYIGAADRLVEDGSNELSVQSTAMNNIHSIVRALRNILPSAEISYSNTNVFTQRFISLCAGAYETVSIILPISECDDSNEGIPGLDTLSTTITENGDYNFIPDGLGFDSVHVVVDVPPVPKPEEEFDVQPTTTDQIITPREGYVFGSGTVRAVTSEIDNNIKPENIRIGINILGVEGTVEVEPDYRYAKGTIDKEGLKAIGWTDEDILTYKQNKTPHYTWQNDLYTVSDENKALYLLDDPDPSSYKDNPNITFVPKKNMEKYFAKSAGFRDMKYIKGIPFFDTSNVANISRMFTNCASLITIPPLDLSSATNASEMFYGCSSLTTIPHLNFSRVTNAQYMFYGCSSLIAVPELNISNATDVLQMFYGCSSLRTIPQLDTSNATNASSLFQGCSKLTTVPPLDLSSATNVSYLFNNCSSLTTVLELNVSNATNVSSLFYNCPNLTTVPELDLSNATNASYLFSGCSKLTNIPPLNTANMTNASNLFGSCSSLKTVEGIDFSGLTKNLTNLFGYSSNMSNLTRFILNGKLNVSISDNYGFKVLKNINYDSVKSILTAADRTDNTNTKTLAFNRTVVDRDGEIAALVASCSTKGWTITGLTFKPREDVILTCSDVVLTDGKLDYIPVTIDAVNNWSVVRENGYLHLGVFVGSTNIINSYGSTPNHWGDLTGQTAGINTANLKVSDFSSAMGKYADLPAGVKFVISFGIKDSKSNSYDYEITLERIDGQITTTLHTISPNA